MKKVIPALLAAVLVFYGCGEAGFQSDISKNIEIDPITTSLTVDDLLVGQLVPEIPPVEVRTGVIDFGDDFEDFLDDAEFFQINEMAFSIINFPGGNSTDLDIEMQVSIAGGAYQQLLSTNVQNAQNSNSKIVIYSKSNPGTVNSGTINALESALLNGQEFEMQVVVTGTDVTLQAAVIDFDIVFGFDVTARIQLN